jgi:protein phosphatase PTC7
MQTDGLSDNVFTPDIVTICSFVARSGGSEDAQAQMMANRIVEYARVCMRERKKMSPFSRKSYVCSHASHLSRTCVVRR